MYEKKNKKKKSMRLAEVSQSIGQMVTETQRNKEIRLRSDIWTGTHVLGFKTYKEGILDTGEGFLFSYSKNFPMV